MRFKIRDTAITIWEWNEAKDILIVFSIYLNNTRWGLGHRGFDLYIGYYSKYINENHS